ncbi:uncharacterized protein [Diadema antillarum]|uniref:uncharacterized protein n=1 Tax=Diadema antillarum TaxID=105358 RepID=UPI003A8819E1
MWAAIRVLSLYLAVSHGLTEEQAALFVTSGEPEENTQLVGWVRVSSSGDDWLIESNNIPDHATGDFPGRGNPNAIQEQDFDFYVAKNPQEASDSTCLPPGPIAIATNGIVIYNPWDSDQENAVEGDGAEIFDGCDGHPDGNGRYHYHRQPSGCLFSVTPGVPSPMIGVAFDGFAIYGPVDESGNLLTSSDLDECHGRNNSDGVYQYHTTADFPYILGCYKGTPQGVNKRSTKCFKASEADAYGNVGSARVQSVSTSTTTAPTTTTTAPTTTTTMAPTTVPIPTTRRRTRTRTRRPARRTRRSRSSRRSANIF